MRRRLRGGRSVVAVLAAVAAYSWWVTGLAPFSWPLRAAVALPAVVLVARAARRAGDRTPMRDWLGDRRHGWRRAWPGDGRTERRRKARAGVLWAALLLALAGVQLFAYFAGFGGQRSDYPTLSWVMDHVEWRAARSALFVGWLAVGAHLVKR